MCFKAENCAKKLLLYLLHPLFNLRKLNWHYLSADHKNELLRSLDQ